MELSVCRAGVGAFFVTGPTTNPDDSSQTILAIAPGGIGLGDKSMYTDAEYVCGHCGVLREENPIT
jgi:hypothetical protein